MKATGAAVTLVMLASMALPAQTTAPVKQDRVTLDVAGGVSRYGRHGFGGLEVAMNRWLALRTEALFGQERQRENGLYYRSTALSFTNVLTYDREARVAPYLFGGVSLAASQGHQLTFIPIGGAGLRLKLGRFEPFVEGRAQQSTIGQRLSIGVRF
jgi:hypothetical protein